MSKEKLQYCKWCKKDTIHVTAFYGMPFHCKEKHDVCLKCGEKLEFTEQEKFVSKSLGAEIIYCKKCTPKISP